MSQQLLSRSPDLKRLRDEGFEVGVDGTYVLVSGVPYLNSSKEIKRGVLVSELTISGDKAGVPKNHVIHFIGEHPCNKDGSLIKQIQHSSRSHSLREGLTVNHSFSNKPPGGYKDYYSKVTRYVEIISAPAQAIDNSVTARTFKVIKDEDVKSVFHYLDTNSSRAEIDEISSLLKGHKIAIIGVGGTGSYVLDLVAKTPVEQIHLYDGDLFLQHNAFRAPGAPSGDELGQVPYKVEYFSKIYSKMRDNIIPHCKHISASNIHELADMSFIFICMDKGILKQELFAKLEEFKVPFIDVGMGVEVVEKSLIGILRVTTSTVKKREHINTKGRVSFADDEKNNEYRQNIQIADLNALNAALAVIKWKKLCGFYHDAEREHFSVYAIDVNSLISEDNEVDA